MAKAYWESNYRQQIDTLESKLSRLEDKQEMLLTVNEDQRRRLHENEMLIFHLQECIKIASDREKSIPVKLAVDQPQAVKPLWTDAMRACMMTTHHFTNGKCERCGCKSVLINVQGETK